MKTKRPRRRANSSWRWALFCLGASLAGCASGGGDGPSFSLPDMKMPAMPSVASITPAVTETAKGSATELYARIASGANACWFGASGPLKKGFIYHAEADAPSRGGKAEIAIHQRDPNAQNPRGPRAYHISIIPKDETSAEVITENLKMNDTAATAMTSDVERWSRGEQGCQNATTAMGWSADPAPLAPPAKTSKTVAAPAKGTKKAPLPVVAKP